MKGLLLILAMVSLAFSASGLPAVAQPGSIKESLATIHVDDLDAGHFDDAKNADDKAPPVHAAHHHHCMGEVAPMTNAVADIIAAFPLTPIAALLAELTGRAEAPPTEPPLA